MCSIGVESLSSPILAYKSRGTQLQIKDKTILKGKLLNDTKQLKYKGKPVSEASKKVQENFFRAIKLIKHFQYTGIVNNEALDHDCHLVNISGECFTKFLGGSWEDYVKKALVESPIIDFNPKYLFYENNHFSQSYKINRFYQGNDCWGLELDFEDSYKFTQRRRRRTKVTEYAPKNFDHKYGDRAVVRKSLEWLSYVVYIVG